LLIAAIVIIFFSPGPKGWGFLFSIAKNFLLMNGELIAVNPGLG
jgi:hypothetical protein